MSTPGSVGQERPQQYSLAGKRVWVAGHKGMVGSAIVRRLAAEGCEVLTVGRDEVDLRRQDAVERWVDAQRPQAVFISAATVGGIYANSSRPAEFIYDNLMIEGNIINAAYRTGVEKLMFLGSSCIYPRLAPQPMTEDALLTGPLEPTNEWYAVAKIAGIKMCQAYRRQYGCDYVSAMPTNLYGPGDSYDPMQSHVLPALILKLHQAKVEGRDEVTIWGSGAVRREFLHVDDAADACVFLMKNYSDEGHVNVGRGVDNTITEVAEMAAEVVGFKGRFTYDRSKPDGTPRKLMDSSLLGRIGWTARIDLREGLASAYAWFLESHAARRA